MNFLPRACVFSAGLMAFAATSHAAQPSDSSPYYLGTSLTRGRDSNVFRLPEYLSPQPDSYTTATLLAGINQPISRQRLYANAEVRRQNFDDLDELSNTGHAFNAGWDWETFGNLSGDLKLGSEQALASYGSPFAIVRGRNIERNRTFNASIQRGTFQNDLQIFAAFNARDTKYSSADFRFRDNDRRALRGGLKWHPNNLLNLGAAWVGARGKYPYTRVLGSSIPRADEYDSHGFELTGDWTASAASSLESRVGYEQRRYNLSSQRNFSGLTGLVRWRWQPTGKLMLTTSLVRDADDSDRLVNTGTTDLTAAGSRITNSMIMDIAWQATAKVTVSGNFRYSDRKLINPSLDASGIVQSLRGSDTTRLAGLGATWAATNSVVIGCNISRESRTTDSGLSFPFKANLTSCYAQLLLK